MTWEDLRYTYISKLGAEEDVQGKHLFYFLNIGGKFHRVGKASHSWRGSTQIPTSIRSKIARTMKLSGPQLHSLVDCSLSKEDFINHLENHDSGATS